MKVVTDEQMDCKQALIDWARKRSKLKDEYLPLIRRASDAGITQTEIAVLIGTHNSVICRQLAGKP